MSDIYIGLMSGTSLDGIDAVAVRFEPEFQILASHSEPLPAPLRQKILKLTQPGSDEIDLMGEVDLELGCLFAQAANNLLSGCEIERSAVKAIGSHGQTIRHRPEAGFTLQIGDANLIAELTGITTVADFRRRDMAAGGQGAPLVPAFHQAQLQSTTHDRILLNIGGMANLTYLPKDTDKPVFGFDTGPGNVLLDAWIKSCRDDNFDANGDWAGSGRVIPSLLKQLLSERFFTQPPPKSTGRELFHLAWLQEKLGEHNHRTEDIQATLLALTVESIASSIRTYLDSKAYELIVCGGGSHNLTMMQALTIALPEAEISNSGQLGIDADWMEAAAFAWLAKRCLEGSDGNLSSVTGASGGRILGAIYQA